MPPDAELPLRSLDNGGHFGHYALVAEALSVAGGESFVLSASRRKWLRVAAGGAALVVGGILIAVGDHNAAGWLVVAFFGVVLVIALWQVIAPATLVVTPTSIESRSLWGRWDRDLASCSEFEVWRNPAARQDLVVFDHPTDSHKKLARSNRALSGRSSSLPDTYGLKAVELAAILNQARARVRRASPDA